MKIIFGIQVSSIDLYYNCRKPGLSSKYERYMFDKGESIVQIRGDFFSQVFNLGICLFSCI